MEDGPEVILEGQWDCSECRNKGIPGGTRTCPNCGHKWNPLVYPADEVYLPDNARAVTDPREIAAAHAGPDWNCGSCGQANPGSSKVCSNCGNPLDQDDNVNRVTTYVGGRARAVDDLDGQEELDDDWTRAVLERDDVLRPLADGPVTMPSRTLDESELPRHSDAGVLNGSRDSGPPVSSDSKRSSWLNRKVIVIASIAAALIVLVLGGVLFLKNTVATHPINLKVQSVSWERQIGVDADKTFSRVGWTVPFGGRVISSHTALRGYNKVFDHYNIQNTTVRKQTGTKPTHYACGTKTKNLGNGHYSSTTKYCDGSTPVYSNVPTQVRTKVYRNVPVYATQYTYLVTQWVFDHYVTASGTTNPHWPTPDNHGSLQRVGNERHESYTVVVTDAQGRSFSESPSQAAWSHLHVGETLKGTENHSGSLRGVTWPTS